MSIGKSNDGLIESVLSALPYIPKKLFGPEQLLETGDIHPSHFHILHMVEQFGPVRMSEVAHGLGINKSNLTPLIQKLEDHQYLIKQRSLEDRRVTIINLTDEGRAFLEDKKAILESRVESRLSTLSHEEQKELEEAFRKVNMILSKLN
ncbi:MarR family winged helix-turn-helix transcriptional regulator [Alkalibacillus haloalkaliphilus]|uniref:MarR family winged helix-turn-helix transcriptional regulator n=1 Tax=Alkalibacillus haloalkaliphilus TaxID=94136 RepID=UPI00293634BF|nr:MarR family transcriptional regulator [Alkalibacillus haloalkaliphilus]MDV2582441.1 MarR family transcriptional regulator [Alkalibacillus haloalkaliphilus]